jgi:hypothetical protein
MVSHFDGTPLPGTTHPMQGYVVSKRIRPQDLYKPGLRSGYNIQRDQWVVPPEHDRSHDVQREQNADYQWALEQADKMDRLLRYEPNKAVQFWHQIHMRRMSDQKQGKGDFSQSNIIYKFLANRGLFPKLEEATGEHIAGAPEPWALNHEAIEKARQQLGLRMPVKVDLVQGTHGQYHGTVNGQHEIDLVSWLKPESASKQLWHEMTHALQLERDPKAWLANRLDYWDTHAQGLGAYRDHPEEIEAREMADSHFFPLVHGIKTSATSNTAKFVYDPLTHSLALGQMGREEGENLSHAQLTHLLGEPHRDLVFGQVGENGYAQTFPRRMIGNSKINPYEAQYGAEESVRRAVPGAKFTNPAELLRPEWDKGDPKVLYAGTPPTLQVANEPVQEPTWEEFFSRVTPSEEAWSLR